MNTVWIVVGLGVAGAIIIALITLWHRRDQQSDLGSVSNQWVAEQRLGKTPNSLRL